MAETIKLLRSILFYFQIIMIGFGKKALLLFPSSDSFYSKYSTGLGSKYSTGLGFPNLSPPILTMEIFSEKKVDDGRFFELSRI